MRRLLLVTALCAVGCPANNLDPDATTNNFPNSSNTTVTNNVTNGSMTNNTNGGTTSMPGDSGTFAPNVCRADLEVIRDEDFEVREHPLAFQGDFFGFRGVADAALMSLVHNRSMVARGDAVPSSPDETLRVFEGDFTVAFDSGVADPDHPVAITSAAEGPDGTRAVLIYSDGLGLIDYGMGGGETVSGDRVGTVTIEDFGELKMNDTGAVFVLTNVEDFDDRVIIRQQGPGSQPVVMAYEGFDFPTGGAGPRFVDTIDWFQPTDFGDVIVRSTIVDGADTEEGFAYHRFSIEDGFQCLATNTSITCPGILANDSQTFDHVSFASDGATTGAYVYNSEGTYHYRIQGPNDGRGEVSLRDEIIPGYIVQDFGRSEVCSKENALYVVMELSTTDDNTRVDELLRIDESGEWQKLTDFRRLVLDESLSGQVPNEIQNLRLGYNCDAILYTYGPSGVEDGTYEGYWAVYANGQTMEILDESPGRRDQIGEVKPSTRARSGMDPNADDDELVHIGPAGEFYFVLQAGETAAARTAHYTVAKQPSGGCP